MERPVLVVVGAGTGVGAAVARRFAREGYDVGLVARSLPRLEQLGAELTALGAEARWSASDVTDAAAFTAALNRLGAQAGRIDVLHFNPSAFRATGVLDLTAGELLEDLALGVAALVTAVSAARPFMSSGGRITVTGSMAADRPSTAAPTLGVQKAGLRNLVRTIDATLAPAGIRAMSLTVNGVLAPDTAFSPEHVAEAVYAAAATPDERWRTEVPYDG